MRIRCWQARHWTLGPANTLGDIFAALVVNVTLRRFRRLSPSAHYVDQSLNPLPRGNWLAHFELSRCEQKETPGKAKGDSL